MHIDDFDVERYRNDREDKVRAQEYALKDRMDRRDNNTMRFVSACALIGFLGILYFLLSMCQADPAVQIERAKRDAERDAAFLILQEKCQDSRMEWSHQNKRCQ